MRKLDISVKLLHQKKFLKLYSISINGRLTPAEIFCMFLKEGCDSTLQYKGVVKEKGYKDKVCILDKPDGDIWGSTTLSDIDFEYVK